MLVVFSREGDKQDWGWGEVWVEDSHLDFMRVRGIANTNQRAHRGQRTRQLGECLHFKEEAEKDAKGTKRKDKEDDFMKAKGKGILRRKQWCQC